MHKERAAARLISEEIRDHVTASLYSLVTLAVNRFREGASTSCMLRRGFDILSKMPRLSWRASYMTELCHWRALASRCTVVFSIRWSVHGHSSSFRRYEAEWLDCSALPWSKTNFSVRAFYSGTSALKTHCSNTFAICTHRFRRRCDSLASSAPFTNIQTYLLTYPPVYGFIQEG